MTDADWLQSEQNMRNFVSNKAGGDETPQAETAPEENGVVNQAQALFGDVVEVIEDW